MSIVFLFIGMGTEGKAARMGLIVQIRLKKPDREVWFFLLSVFGYLFSVIGLSLTPAIFANCCCAFGIFHSPVVFIPLSSRNFHISS